MEPHGEMLPNLPVIVDKPTVELEREFTRERMRQINRQVLADLSIELPRQVKRPAISADGTYDPQLITTYLLELHRYLEGYIQDLASGYSSARWLWYLRRLPFAIFEGSHPTTFGYDSALADVASGLFGVGSDNIRIGADEVKYDLSGAVGTRLLRLCYAVRQLSQVHVSLRFAGKGVSFRFEPGNPFPYQRLTSAESESIKLYDARTGAAQVGFLRAGTELIGSQTESVSGLLIVHRMAPEWFPVDVRSADGAGTRECQVLARFGVFRLGLDRIKQLLTDPRLSGQQWIGPEVSSLFSLLHLVPRLLSRLPSGPANLLQRGYLMIEEHQLKSWFDEYVPQTAANLESFTPGVPVLKSGSDVYAKLDSIKGGLWPLRLGPVVRRAESMVFLDLYAASSYLDAGLEFPRVAGPAANARADHFEISVQAGIDSTNWAPREPLKEIRGRQLRIDGDVLTDIDSIAASGDVLLLVSCKSLIYSGAYDTGDYATVRNSVSTILEGLEKWNSVIARISKTPSGDNFDFSEFKTIVPLLCTPHPLYVPMGEATVDVLKGLRAVVSLEEFVIWLQNNPVAPSTE